MSHENPEIPRQPSSQDPHLESDSPLLDEFLSKLKRGESPYRDVIKSLVTPEAFTPYQRETESMFQKIESDSSAPGFKKIKQFLDEKLPGNTFIDLGGNNDGLVHRVAMKFNAPTSVSVDKMFIVTPKDGISRSGGEFEYLPLDPFTNVAEQAVNKRYADKYPERGFIAADMLDFVSRLPDNSTNYMMNGVDGFIIDETSEYAKSLAKEIYRTLKPGGVIFGNAFWAVQEELVRLGLKEVLTEKETGLHRDLVRVRFLEKPA